MTNQAKIDQYLAIKERFERQGKEPDLEELEFLFSLLEEKTAMVEIGVTSEYDVVFEAAIKQLGHTILDSTWHEEKNETYYKVEK